MSETATITMLEPVLADPIDPDDAFYRLSELAARDGNLRNEEIDAVVS
jgi:hypothetical protein